MKRLNRLGSAVVVVVAMLLVGTVSVCSKVRAENAKEIKMDSRFEDDNFVPDGGYDCGYWNDVPVWFAEGPVMVQGVAEEDGTVSIGVSNFSGRDLSIVVRDITSGNKRVVPSVVIKCPTEENTLFLYHYEDKLSLNNDSTLVVDVLDMNTGEELFMDNQCKVSGIE